MIRSSTPAAERIAHCRFSGHRSRVRGLSLSGVVPVR